MLGEEQVTVIFAGVKGFLDGVDVLILAVLKRVCLITRNTNLHFFDNSR